MTELTVPNRSICRRDRDYAPHTHLLVRLHENVRFFPERLRSLGYAPLDGEAAIIPIIVGETARAIELSRGLLERGVFVTGFGYPVVAEGAARIRVQLSAAHEPDQLERALAAFAAVAAQHAV